MIDTLTQPRVASRFTLRARPFELASGLSSAFCLEETDTRCLNVAPERMGYTDGNGLIRAWCSRLDLSQGASPPRPRHPVAAVIVNE